MSLRVPRAFHRAAASVPVVREENPAREEEAVILAAAINDAGEASELVLGREWTPTPEVVGHEEEAVAEP